MIEDRIQKGRPVERLARLVTTGLNMQPDIVNAELREI